jgi:16S rRNA (cytidine1402-2'-O)-methyltransferase
MLTLVATPIGNLRDISERARQVLSSCEIVLCEDTRHTGLLFHSLGLTTPRFMSLHKFNEASREDEIIELLRSGKEIAVVCDAGTPAIADPGSHLVARCHREHLSVSAVPGPCAFATAFALSGATCTQMQFLGFLPKSTEQLVEQLRAMHRYPGASVVYESPHRLQATVACAAGIDGSWELVMVRELTKVHEEIVRCSAADLSERLMDREVKGECVVVFLPCPLPPPPSSDELLAAVHSARDTFGCSLKEAVEVVAKHYDLSQRQLYQVCIQSSGTQ